MISGALLKKGKRKSSDDVNDIFSRPVKEIDFEREIAEVPAQDADMAMDIEDNENLSAFQIKVIRRVTRCEITLFIEIGT